MDTEPSDDPFSDKVTRIGGSRRHYTDRLRGAISDANALANLRQSPSVGPDHFFLSISRSGCANAVLESLGYSLEDLQSTFDSSIAGSDAERGVEAPYSRASTDVFHYAKNSARSMRHKFLGDEHILVALVAIESPVSKFLQSKGLTAAAVEAQVLELLGSGLE